MLGAASLLVAALWTVQAPIAVREGRSLRPGPVVRTSLGCKRERGDRCTPRLSLGKGHIDLDRSVLAGWPRSPSVPLRLSVVTGGDLVLLRVDNGRELSLYVSENDGPVEVFRNAMEHARGELDVLRDAPLVLLLSTWRTLRGEMSATLSEEVVLGWNGQGFVPVGAPLFLSAEGLGSGASEAFLRLYENGVIGTPRSAGAEQVISLDARGVGVAALAASGERLQPRRVEVLLICSDVPTDRAACAPRLHVAEAGQPREAHSLDELRFDIPAGKRGGKLQLGTLGMAAAELLEASAVFDEEDAQPPRKVWLASLGGQLAAVLTTERLDAEANRPDAQDEDEQAAGAPAGWTVEVAPGSGAGRPLPDLVVTDPVTKEAVTYRFEGRRYARAPQP